MNTVEYIVKDPYISCVMSENGKHWNITTNESPEMVRMCTFNKHEKISDNYPTCSACGYEADWHECEPYGYSGYEYKKNYCPNCGARVINNE